MCVGYMICFWCELFVFGIVEDKNIIGVGELVRLCFFVEGVCCDG